jgi:hypothetical protein
MQFVLGLDYIRAVYKFIRLPGGEVDDVHCLNV